MRIAIGAVVLLVGCGFPGHVPWRGEEPFHLKVALFPWIPDEASPELARHIQSAFERAHPDARLELVIDKTGSEAYTVPESAMDTSGWWGRPPEKGGAHLLEVDALLLKELAERNAIRPWRDPPGQEDWLPAGAAAARVGAAIYGIPHWLCGHFVFSHSRRVQGARSASQLIAAVKQTQPPRLAGEFAGSFTVPSLYLDAYADTHGNATVAEGLARATTAECLDPKIPSSARKECLDGPSVDGLRKVVAACEDGRPRNPCLSAGDYPLCPDLPAKLFAAGQVGAVVGYSERLYVIRSDDANTPVLLSSAPLGSGESPLVFVDVFVLHRSCNGRCEQAAQQFVAFMNAADTHEWIQFHRDRESGVPRYLLSATRSAWQKLDVDPYYRTLHGLIEEARPYPNGGLVDQRKALRDLIQSSWSNP